LLATGVATADDEIELFDADGDGDIDDDDRAILEHAEEVRVIDKSEGQKLRESARAVTVIDTKVAKERTADMGEVLSRAQGIQIRRSGGLGSAARISLNGLYDESIRTFIDGVPAELAGFGGGIENVPIGLVNRVDVHRGVVPISLGADALGGAIDLVSDAAWVNSAAVSYQTGSFGTHRATGITRTHDPSTGAALSIAAFFDRTDNDYLVSVEVPDAQGRITARRVPRFHDGYQASGVNAEVGLVKRGMIKRALLRLYYSQSDKELQHNLVMKVPYGEATHGEVARGGVLNTLVEHDGWRAHIVLGGVRRWGDFDDRAQVVYDWLGKPVRDRKEYGEIGVEAFIRTVSNSGFGRFTLERSLGSSHVLRLSTAPTITKRRGTDFLHDPALGRDPASARQDLAQVVSGVEYELRAIEDRFENIAFAKHYLSKMNAEDAQWMAPFVPKEHSIQTVGVGDMLRYQLTPRLIAKASYEWSTRLPTADEIFGDGALLHPRYELTPERSHNLNVGGRLQNDQLQVDINAFARQTKDMILLLAGPTYSYYDNVYAARVVGIETGATWVAPSEWASLEGSVTVQDVRNVSSSGTFGAYDGDRIPNRPWLLASLGGTIQQRELLRDDDEVALFANSRYVNGFWRGWESVGTAALKDKIATQLVHSAGVTYALRNKTPIVTTFEVSNLLDAQVFDSFGVERPGRAFYLRLSAEM
jgi:hypothetical protein